MDTIKKNYTTISLPKSKKSFKPTKKHFLLAFLLLMLITLPVFGYFINQSQPSGSKAADSITDITKIAGNLGDGVIPDNGNTVPSNEDIISENPGDDTTVPGDDTTVPGDDTTVPGDDTTVPGDDSIPGCIKPNINVEVECIGCN